MTTGKFPPFRAMTYSPGGLINSIITQVKVSSPINDLDAKIEKHDPRLTDTTALWDTGATHCCISKKLAIELNLIPSGRTDMSHAKGKESTNTYTLDIFLPNEIWVPGCEVMEIEGAAGNFGIIIGMDIITMGDLAITNVNGNTMFSFRVPSVSHIDFVKEIRLDAEKILSKTGRNEKCPCGSGKKFKDCHLKK